MQQADIITIIEEVAPLALAAAWDKSGVQVASSRAVVGHLAVSLDPTPETVRKALAVGADMLLTHHPLTLSPRFPDRLDAYHAILSLLFSHNVPLYAAHTSLDANPEGPSGWLPDELGLTNRSVLESSGEVVRPDGSRLQGGFGCVGDLPESLTPGELAARVGGLLPLRRMNRMARLAGNAPERVRRLAVCTGSGSSLLEDAWRLGADMLITGDLKYHTALDVVTRSASGGGFAVLDPGHFSLEEEMMRRFALFLEKRLPGVTVTFVPGMDPFHPIPLSSEDVPEVLS